MYGTVRFEIDRDNKVIDAKVYDKFYSKKLSTAADYIRKTSFDKDGLTPQEFKMGFRDWFVTFVFYKEFCDGNAQWIYAGSKWINDDTRVLWCLYETDDQRYIYEQPVTDLQWYRSMIDYYSWKQN